MYVDSLHAYAVHTAASVGNKTQKARHRGSCADKAHCASEGRSRNSHVTHGYGPTGQLLRTHTHTHNIVGAWQVATAPMLKHHGPSCRLSFHSDTLRLSGCTTTYVHASTCLAQGNTWAALSFQHRLTSTPEAQCITGCIYTQVHVEQQNAQHQPLHQKPAACNSAADVTAGPACIMQLVLPQHSCTVQPDRPY